VTQQFLDRAEIAAAAEQMRREAVAQRVRGCCFGEAEGVAQCLHLALHDPRVERPAPRADKKRAIGRERVRAGGELIGDGVAHRRQDRDEPLLSSLAGDRDQIAARRFGAMEAEGFGETQPTAV